MTMNQFIVSLENEIPPNGISQLLEALWWEKKGEFPFSMN
jgi:hypothetical protein